MKLKCEHVYADEAGEEIFQVLFEVQPEQEDAPYLLISQAFFEEDEGESSAVYVETNDESLTGHYANIKAQLERSSLTLRLPPPVDDTIKVDFTTSEGNFKKVKRMLRIIFQEDIG
jgi:hypothetical protein